MTPSWNCVWSACDDPGKGVGMHTDQVTCTAICGISAVNNILQKKLIKIIDFLVREIKGINNEVLFYIYDDGTLEKRID